MSTEARNEGEVTYLRPVVLRYREAAKVLGVSPRTLWLWTKAGIVPHVRVGLGRRKIILYPLDELRSWLARQSQASQRENHSQSEEQKQ
jgi:excisionase family DNA binding protein